MVHVINVKLRKTLEVTERCQESFHRILQIERKKIEIY